MPFQLNQKAELQVNHLLSATIREHL
ncbi:unnamed protein product, partial [Rotaria magnacalcarata]